MLNLRQAQTDTRTGTHSNTAGDAAVDGLIGGVIAGIGMALFLVVVQWLGGESPVQLLTRFSVGTPSPVVGALLHLAVAGIYGIGFGILYRFAPRALKLARGPSVVMGVVYGLVVFFLAETILLPGAGSALLAIPAVTFALAHVLYGGVLGWWTSNPK